MDARFWDERYESRDQLFSGRPNGVLVAEVSGLTPGQALDIGCGEGGDAIWLAEQGWNVTAVDLSRVALDRAAAAGAHLADRVSWSQGDLAAAPPPVGSFDLVSAQYYPILRSGGSCTVRGLLDAVAPGGTLLVVGHAAPPDSGENHGFDFDDYLHPADIARFLGREWAIVVNETRPRVTPPPEGTHHTHDTVLRARRR
ncbi:class I SAM-dependent methyltransferase [Glycomyces harbinensis]|uniref:Methyltransferase domain-containing protein n=1 Tax=Glycomyces harbinensis TaxID=58114 RepID=A0A1G7ATS8_9ACTN|nr:class I SAM-dependent methyltransferase [Glycomyces harbinensis]SDE17957.1 Methyltransferase domain-containing protein [Glycomyces harbinensis]